MAYLVQCNRCGEIADVVFRDIDTGYWTQPDDWLSVKTSYVHLCPACKARALEKPDTEPEASDSEVEQCHLVNPHSTHLWFPVGGQLRYRCPGRKA